MNRHKPYQPNLAYVDENGKLILLHDSGFFSCCTIRLRKIINYYNEYKIMPIVDSSKQWTKFYKDEIGDVTNKFFKFVDINLNRNNEILFSSDTLEDQFSDYSKINYNEVKIFVKRYFSVSDNVYTIENQLLQKYNINLNNTIAVCYRGTDKRTEIKIPTYDKMIENINFLKTKNPSHKILLQTDEIEFLEIAKNTFSDLIYFSELSAIPSNSRATQFYFKTGEKVKNASVFLAVMQILSKSEYVLLNSGNVGMWICLFRNSFKNVVQL